MATRRSIRGCWRSTRAEKPGRHLTGAAAAVVGVLGAGLSLFAVYWVIHPISAQQYRPAFLAVALLLTFLVFGRDERPTGSTGRSGSWRSSPPAMRSSPPTSCSGARRSPSRSTSSPASSPSCSCSRRRAARSAGSCRRSCIGFIAYAYLGGLIPDALGIGHKGYGVDRLVGQSYMGLEGLFGIPLDVAATYIVLFTLYGAVLEFSGAARFFVQLSYAAFGSSATGPGRTTTLAGFLLGTVSGSGVATTVTLGSVTWPLLRRAGYPANEGGGILSASGIGAILSPPTLGAAAFIIAEFLEECYFKVLLYALVPTLLYYLGSCWRSRPTRGATRSRASTSTRPASGSCSPAGATTSRR